jgi:signal peptidase I
MIDTIKITLPITVYNEHLDNTPTHLTVTLNEKDLIWINKMHEIVKEHDIYFIAAGDKTSDYPSYIKIDEDDDTISKYDGGIECEKIYIKKTVFFWGGIIKYTDVSYESEAFSIDDLNMYFRFMKKPIIEMPKYINDEDEYLQEIAKQRMTQGE